MISARLPARRRLARRAGGALAAFTATADAETRDEIIARLFDDAQPLVFCAASTGRTSIWPFRPGRPRRQILDFAAARRGQSGIVYYGTRAKTETLAQA